MQKKIIAVSNDPTLPKQNLHESYEQFKKDLAQSIHPELTTSSPEYKIILEKIHAAIEYAKIFGVLLLDKCSLVKVPNSLQTLTNLTTLSLNNNKLVEFPNRNFCPPELKHIDLSDNNILAFPYGYSDFTHFNSGCTINLHLNPITVRVGNPSKDDLTELYSPMTFKELRRMYPDAAEAPLGIRNFLESKEAPNGYRINLETGKLYSPYIIRSTNPNPCFMESDLEKETPAIPTLPESQDNDSDDSSRTGSRTLSRSNSANASWGGSETVSENESPVSSRPGSGTN